MDIMSILGGPVMINDRGLVQHNSSPGRNYNKYAEVALIFQESPKNRTAYDLSPGGFACEFSMEPYISITSLHVYAGLHTYSYSHPGKLITFLRTCSNLPHLNHHNIAQQPTNPLYSNITFTRSSP